MTQFLIEHFVKDYEDVEKISVRTAYGVLASIVGIFCNVFLFAVKFTIGVIAHSVSVMADAFNNLSDAGSSIISFIGVKMAEKPADRDHPFGHGRIEYIAALVVSFLILEVGFTFLKDSIGKIRTPEMLNFQIASVIILILSIGVKLWLGLFNKRLGEKINSKVMMAVFADSMGDVITTGATILSLIVFRITGWNIDGVVGIGVALVVMWAGVGIAKDTLEPLIGEAIDPQVYDQIKAFVEKYDGIVGTHDLIVHNYGPNQGMATIHAEVPNDVNIEVSHAIIDRIEREVGKELNITLVIHMDPVELHDAEVLRLKEKTEHIIKALDSKLSFHDFRLVKTTPVNLIFDLLVPAEYTQKDTDRVLHQLMQLISEMEAGATCVITVDHSFEAPEE